MNRAENREIMSMLKLRGVPTIIFAVDGTAVPPRLTGDESATPANIEAAISGLLKIKH